MTVLLGSAMLLPATDAFFDNLIELPMNMAGYMSVARASTECEDQASNVLVEIFIWDQLFGKYLFSLQDENSV